MFSEMMKKVYGVMGDPIEHSLSPVMHNTAFEALGINAIYLAFRVSIDEVGDAIRGARSLGIAGLNVTIPLKEKALEFVVPDALASRIGAINTIDFSTGTPRGYNTDGIGALRVLREAVGELHNKKVLILGAGGAARAIAFYLDSEGSILTIANRNVERARRLASALHNAEPIGMDELERIKDADILINATPVGMYPHEDETLVDAGLMHSELVVFDIVYNPLETRLLKEAKKAGVRTLIGGLKMLLYQGAASFRIWTGMEPPLSSMERAVREALSVRAP